MKPLDRARARIAAGEIEEAKRELFAILNADPHDGPAWMLLASLLQDPDKQADCYRRALRADPGNRQAAEKLRAVTGEDPSPGSPSAGDGSLRCPHCGGAMEVRFVGELRDKRAACRHCGSEVNLPNTYRRVQRRHEHEERDGGSRMVDTTVIEMRSDRGEAGPLPLGQEEVRGLTQEQIQKAFGDLLAAEGRQGTLPGDVDTQQIPLHALDEALKGEGVYLSKEELAQVVQDSGLTLSADGQTAVQRIERRTSVHSLDSPPSPSGKRRGPWGRLLGLLTQRRVRTGSDTAERGTGPGNLSTEEIIRLAGGPLPPEERQKCPQCEATISKQATWCQWCGARFARFSGSEERIGRSD